MQNGKKIVCCLPAYNAEKTLAATLRDVPPGVVDLFILVDDASQDATLKAATPLTRKYPFEVFSHEQNLGYGANQKTCYRAALERGADVVVMLHPDYQYDPTKVPLLTEMVSSGRYDVALGSRILEGGAIKGGMPLYKFISNRLLTVFENLCLGQNLSEYHTGFRVYSREVLQSVPFESFSDDFVFDNEILVDIFGHGFRVGELAVPARYFAEASSISFGRSVSYGLGVLRCSLKGLGRRLRGTHRKGKRTNGK